MVTWMDDVTNTWKIVVYRFETGELSDIIDTGLSTTDWVNYDTYQIIQNKGFSISYESNIDNSYKIYFLNPAGSLVDVKDLDTDEDFQFTENAQIYLGSLDSKATVYHFTSDSNVYTHIFDGLDSNEIEVDDADDDDVTADGSIIIVDKTNNKYYIGRPDGVLVEITEIIVDTTGFPGMPEFDMSYNSDFIPSYSVDMAYDTIDTINIISQEGVLKNSLNFNEGEFTLNRTSFYGDNCSLFELNGVDTYQSSPGVYAGQRKFIAYDSDDNTFVSVTFSNTLIQVATSTNNEIDWYSPVPSFGKNLVTATWNTIESNQLGYVSYEPEIYWLPKGATEFQSYIISGTVTLIEGLDHFSGNRTFTIGEKPLIMYGVTGSEIQLGFLTNSGMEITTTGIQFGSCSNIWGHNIGDKSFAVFDITDDSRIWQIYNSESIIEETTTTNNWNMGQTNMSANRYGTLAVIDNDDQNNSFIYTTELGLVGNLGITGSAEVFNDINYGNRTGISLSDQVIVKYKDDNSNVQGFYLVTLSGLSDFVEILPGLSPSTDYTINDLVIGEQIISIALSTLQILGQPNSPDIVLVYDKSDLSLIYSEGVDNYSLYSDRCFTINYLESTTLLKFVGKQGIDTLEINQTNSDNILYMSNDIVNAD
jgi:hypothetical protein